MKQIWIRDEDHEKLRKWAYQERKTIVGVAAEAFDNYFGVDEEKEKE